MRNLQLLRKSGQIRRSQKLQQDHLKLFVRHWFCGLCSGYLMELKDKPYFRPLFDDNSEESKKFELVVVGHGKPEGIENFRQFAGGLNCQIYADQEKKLYKALGITNKTTDLGPEGVSFFSALGTSTPRVLTLLSTPLSISKAKTST